MWMKMILRNEKERNGGVWIVLPSRHADSDTTFIVSKWQWHQQNRNNKHLACTENNKPHQRKVCMVNMSLHDWTMSEPPVHFLQHIYSKVQGPNHQKKKPEHHSKDLNSILKQTCKIGIHLLFLWSAIGCSLYQCLNYNIIRERLKKHNIFL